jgi:hypothetical protein
LNAPAMEATAEGAATAASEETIAGDVENLTETLQTDNREAGAEEDGEDTFMADSDWDELSSGEISDDIDSEV